MYNYVLLFLLVVCFVVFCIWFRKKAKSLAFVLGVVWFVVEILTVLYKIVIWANMEERLRALSDALTMSKALSVFHGIEMVLVSLSNVLLVSVVVCYFLRNRKKNKANQEKEITDI